MSTTVFKCGAGFGSNVTRINLVRINMEFMCILTLASFSGFCHLHYFIVLLLLVCKCGGRRPGRACQIWQCQCDAMGGIPTKLKGYFGRDKPTEAPGKNDDY